MYHSLIFWDGTNFYTQSEARSLGDLSLTGTPKGINTWRDWHLIPTEKPAITLPAYDPYITELEGHSGSIDITDKVFGGEIIYGDRTGALEFYIHHDYVDWKNVRVRIIQALHGKKVKMILEDELQYYYVGRFTLTKITPQASYSQLTLSYQLEPYRYRVVNNSSLGNVYWDPFNFETDYDYTVNPYFDHAAWIKEMTEGVL